MATINGNNSDNVLVGTTSNDTMNGRGGDDTISGGDGNDKIDGGSGNDTIDGGSGDDSIKAGSGDDTVDGGAGNDVINGASGNDIIDGGDGNDTIDGGADNDTIDGGAGNDTIAGGFGDDIINGGSGDDIINGESGIDIIDGGDGNDIIDGGIGDDVIDGSAGDDRIDGNDGNDTMRGGTGNDTLIGAKGADTFTGGEGDDLIVGGVYQLVKGTYQMSSDDSAFDTALYSGSLGVHSISTTSDGQIVLTGMDYTITKNTDGSMTITDTNFADGNTGVDTLLGIEYLEFNGVTYNVATLFSAAPVTVDDTAVVQDGAVVPVSGNVLTNDVNGSALAVYNAGTFALTYGTITILADGSYTFTLDNSNPTVAALHDGDSLIQSFTYTALNAQGAYTTGTLNITIEGVSHAPVAAGETYELDQDSTIVIAAASGVLANDTDADGDPLTATLVTGAAHGVVVMNADGSFSYTPDAGFYGADSFTYKANDGSLDSDVVTVTLTVNEVNYAPVAAGESYQLNQDSTIVITAVSGVLANDTDADGDPLTANLVTGAAHGVVVMNADGSFSYTPDAGFYGADSFTYKANDGSLDSNIVTVNLAVESNENAPQILISTYDVHSSLSTDSFNVSGYFADPNDLSLTFELASEVPGLEIDSAGNLTFSGFTPGQPYVHLDGASVIAVNGNGLASTPLQLEGYVFDASYFNAYYDGTAGDDIHTSVVTSGTTYFRELMRMGDGDDIVQVDPSYVPYSVYNQILRVIDGGDGVDTVDYSIPSLNPGSTIIDLEAGTMSIGGTVTDMLINIENVMMNNRGSFYGNGEDNVVFIKDVSGSSYLDGRGGNDTVSFADNTNLGGLVMRLDSYFLGQTNGITSRITNFENVIGTSFDDDIVGTSSANIITGGFGNDTMTGNQGADTFVFGLLASDGNDVITDFNITEDILQFNGVSTLAEVNAHITAFNDNGGHLQIAFDTGATIDFNSVTYASISDPSSHLIESLVDASQVKFG